MTDDTLVLLADEVRGKTLRLLKDVTDAQARFHAPSLNNSILWHAGHALIVVEHLGVVPATGGTPFYPAGWFDSFSWMSKPATVTTWPTVQEVVAKLTDQLERLRSAIAALPVGRLDQIVDPARDRTLRYSILHGLHDEAMHQGEIHLLKKLAARSQAPS
jgi:hypothetical protein